MSKTLEGRVSNQSPKYRFNSGNPQVTCECCSTLVLNPDKMKLTHPGSFISNQVFSIFSYISTPYFIYESNSGYAVVYCSDHCRRKHNHRFQKIDKQDRRLKKFEEDYGKAVQNRDWQTCEFLSDVKVLTLLRNSK